MGALVVSALVTLAPVTAAAPAVSGSGFGPRVVGGVNASESNWGGYIATGQTFTSISGSWVEPHVTCSGSELYAPWVGLDGYNDQTVEQTGVQTECVNGTPEVSAWYEMFPAGPKYFTNPASIGDHFTASVQSLGNEMYTLTISDTTAGWSETVTKSIPAMNASAEAIIEAPGGFPAIPHGVTFTHVTANGQPLSAYSPVKSIAYGGWVPGPLHGGAFRITQKGS
jgi:hypothetical protein